MRGASTWTRFRSTSTPDALNDARSRQDDVVSLASLCLARREPIEHIRALIRAGNLPAPTRIRSDGMELVARDYFHVLDAAGGARHIRAYLRGVRPPEGANAIPAEDAESPTCDPWALFDEGRFEIAAGPREKASHCTSSDDDLWEGHIRRELGRFRDGAGRLAGADGPESARRREQQLMRIASAAWGAGLALLMIGDDRTARSWLLLSAVCYRRSLADAEPGSWGRSIGALKARLIAGDLVGALQEAEWTLDLRAEGETSVIGNYADCLASLLLGEDGRASDRAVHLVESPEFPPATGEACRALAALDSGAYTRAIKDVLQTFEERSRFLEDIPVADTVITLQVLAEQRGVAVSLDSSHLPSRNRTRAVWRDVG